MTDITDPLDPFSLGGNLTLQIDMKDASSNGQTDEIAVTVWDSNGGMYFSSRWSGTNTILQLLNGGNISIK